MYYLHPQYGFGSLLHFRRLSSPSKQFSLKKLNIQDPIFGHNIKPCATFHNKGKGFSVPMINQ